MKSMPPWNLETELFEQPDATCELFLDGQKRSVSVALWEGYCYLQVADLNGLWAITRPYDDTNLAQFVAEQIQYGEVGKVWTFESRLMNFDYITQEYIDTDGALPIISASLVPLVAIVRNDNSALVRIEDQPKFVETEPPYRKKKRRLRAQIPSIWHPARKFIEQRHIAKLAQLAFYPPLPKEALFTWEKGSLPEAVLLLETLYRFAFEKKQQLYMTRFVDFHWPLERENLVFPAYMHPKMEMIRFLQIIWDNHHCGPKDWLPNRSYPYSLVSNKRTDWDKANSVQNLALRREVPMTAHEQIEAAMALHDLFKDKISDEEINELLRETV